MRARDVIAGARAFAVTFGGSVIVDAAAAASLDRTARSLGRLRRPPAWALAGTVLTGLYLFRARKWMAGRHKIEIDAPPEAVWPWVAQLGQDRGGFYSYDWLENLAGCHMHSAGEIHPEWQHREIGEKVYLHPLNGLPVTRFEPNRAFSLEGWGPWLLEPLPDGRTQLAVETDYGRGLRALPYVLLMELPHYVMERRMLVGIKQRAERARAQAGPARRSSSSSAAAFAAASSAARSLAS